MTKEQFANLMVILFESFGRTVSKAQLQGYEIGLRGVDDGAMKDAVAAVLQQNRQHPPSPGELRAIATGATPDDLEARAHAAFERADRLAREVGREANPRLLEDPLLTHAIGSVGGWESFCGTIDHWQKRNFVAAYVAAAGNPQLENVAKLSHAGEPIGALPETRKLLANKLGRETDG